MVARVHSGLRRGRGVLVALSLAAALFLMLGFLLNPAAQASLLAQAAPTSSIKLEWNGTTLALTEQNNGANGQVTVGTYAERVCTLEVIVCLTWEDRSGMEISVGGTFASGSSAGGSNDLVYKSSGSPTSSNIARIRLDSRAVPTVLVNMGSGSSSSLTFNFDKQGKITDAGIRSGGALTLQKLVASRQITAVVGIITASGSGINASAPTLQLYGTYGVGSAGQRLGTAANPQGTGWTLAEVNAYTGSVYLNHSGDLGVGITTTNAYTGIQVLAKTGSYVVDLSASGTVSVSMVGETLKAPSAISVTVGAAEFGCMSAGIQPRCAEVTNGPLAIAAQETINLGAYRNKARFYGDITGKGVTLEAGDTITIAMVTYVTAAGGPLNMRAGKAVRVLNLNNLAGATFFTSGKAPVDIEAPEFVMASGGTIASSQAPLTITTDSPVISATVRAPGNVLLLQPKTPGRPFDLGLGTTPGAVNITAAQLASIDAANGTVRIGGPKAGPITVTAPITRAGTAKLWLDTPYTLTQSGRIANDSLFIGAGMQGTLDQANAAARTTTVANGLVKFNRSGGPAVSGGLIVGDGEGLPGSAIARLEQNTQFTTTANLIINSDGVLELNGKQQAVGGLYPVATAGDIDLGGGTLTTTNTSGYRFNGVIKGTGTLVKSGLGDLELTNDNTFGSLKLLQGRVLFTGKSTSDVTLIGGYLGGTGSVGDIEATGGTLDPGLSPGIFTATSLIMGAASELRMEINGTGAGQFDRLNVTDGPITLTGAKLTIAAGASLAADPGYILIDNQSKGTVSGLFADLPEGTLVTVGSQQLAISYVGCDGNDVVLGTPDCGGGAQGVSGVVFDAATGVPLVGASVVVTDSTGSARTGTTTAGGWYTITTGVAAGTATVAASSPGYATARATVAVTAATVAFQDLGLLTSDLIASKDDGAVLVNGGEVVSYTIAIRNSGALTATGVVVTDVLPAYMSYVRDTAGVTPTSTAPLTYTWSLPGELAPGAGFTFTLAAQVSTTLPYSLTNLTNRVVASTGSPERDTTNNGASDTNQVIAYPDLSLSKSGLVAALPVSRSVTITHVLQGSNAGYAPARGVRITDSLDSQVTYSGTAKLSVNGQSRTVTTTLAPLSFDLPDLAPGDSYRLTFTVVVTNSLDPNQPVIRNDAAIATTDVESNLTNNAGRVNLPARPGAQLYLEKTAQPASLPLRPGDTVLYTLDFGNVGNTNATTITISDTLPAGVTLVDASPGYSTTGGSVVTWSAGPLNTGAADTLTYTVAIDKPFVAADLQLTNTAVITTPQGDIYVPDNTASAAVAVTALPDLVIAQSHAGRATAEAGELITYTITYSNAGERGAAGVVITESVLANLTLVSSDPAGNCDGTRCTWNIGSLPVNGAHTITVTARASSGAADGAPAGVRAVIAAGANSGADLDLGNNSNVAASRIGRPLIVLAKSSQGAAFIGRTITYTIAFSNQGSETAAAVVISDRVPAGTAVVPGSISGGGSAGGGVVSWNAGPAAPGAGGVVSYVVTVNSKAGITTAISPSLAALPAAGSGLVTSSVAPVSGANCAAGAACAGLKGLWQGTDPTGPAGWNLHPQLVTFDETAWITPAAAVTESTWSAPQNLGAAWVAVTTTVHAQPTYSFYRQRFCLPLNAAGFAATVQQANAGVGDIYVNGALVGQQNGAGSGGSFAVTTGSLQSGLNLLAVRTAATGKNGLIFNLGTSYSQVTPFVSAPVTVLAGRPTTFTMIPQLLGGSRPYSYSIAYGDGASGGNQVGETFTYTYTAPGEYIAAITARDQYGCTGVDRRVVKVLSADALLLANAATVGYANGSGVQYSAGAGAGSPLAIDLAVSKSSQPQRVVAGRALTYTLRVTSTGGTAHNVVVQDTLPPAAMFAGADVAGGSCSESAGFVTCQLGSLADGETRAITLRTAVDLAARNVITNSVTVAGDEIDPNATNNSAAAQTAINSDADLGVTKVSTPTLHVSDGPITYTVVVTNGGPVAVTAITVTDRLPSDVDRAVYVPSTGSYDENSGLWSDILLAAGERITLTISGRVVPTSTGDLVNTVAVTSPQSTDPYPGNNEAVDVNARLELRLSKQGALDMEVSVPSDRADVGDVIRYTLIASNTLPITLTDVAISDAKLGSLGCTQPVTLATGGSLTCTGVYTLTQADIVAGQVENTAIGTFVVTNTGAITGLAPQVVTVVVPVPQSPGLQISKSGPAGPVTIGDRIDYRITVTNTGNLPLDNVRLVDASLLLTRTIATLAPGQSATYTATRGPVTESDPLTILNTAVVTALTPASAISAPVTIGPISSTYTVTVVPLADLKIGKSSSASSVGTGALLTYTVVVTNGGPATARAVTVTEGLPWTGLGYVTHTVSSGSYSSTTGLWQLTTLSATKAATLTLVTRVLTDSAVTNVATVTSTVADPAPGNNSATKTVAVQPTGIHGRVYDAGTLAPIVGAQVVVTDSAGTVFTPVTASGGWYTVTYRAGAPLAAGPITVTTGYAGYAAGRATATVVYGSMASADVPLHSADLLITKSEPATSIQPGQRISYTIAVRNLGTLTATNVVITDVLPAYMAYITDTSRLPANVTAPLTYSWALTSSLAPGKGFTFTLSTQVTVAMPVGTTYLTNGARTGASSPDRNLANNVTAYTHQVTAYRDLNLMKRAETLTPTEPISVGQQITYVLSGSNAGNTLASGVTITDVFATELLSYTAGSAQLRVNGASATLAVSATGGLLFDLPDLLPGGTYVLTYTAVITDDIPAGTFLITNTAVIDSDQADADEIDNSDSGYLPTQPGVLLYIVNRPKAQATPARPGDVVTYTLPYGNAGNTSAGNTTVTATLPAGTRFMAGSPGVLYDPLSRIVAYPLGTLSAAAAGVVTFSVQISSPLPAGSAAIVNSALITTPDGVLSEEFITATARVAVSAAPDLGIAKRSGLAQVDAGGTVTYTLVYSNAGNMEAAGVVITDTPLANLALLSAEPPYSRGVDGSYAWDIGTLTVDGAHTITVVAAVTDTVAIGAIAANRAEIDNDESLGADTDRMDNVSTDLVHVVRPFVVLEKDVSGQPAVGGILTYTIAYRNLGAGAATAMVISDVIPVSTTLVAGSIGGGGSEAGGVITWAFPVAARASGVLTFAVQVEEGAGNDNVTAPGLAVEPGAGSTTVTSSATSAAPASLTGIWQGEVASGPRDWNSNPQVVDFDASGWLAPIDVAPDSAWLPAQSLDAQWVAMTDTLQSAANYSFYRQAFCVPLNAEGLSASLQQANAGVGDIYLNGAYLDSQSGPGAAGNFGGDAELQSGFNLLAVRLLNNPNALPEAQIGLLFKLQAAYSGLRPFAAAPQMVMADQMVTFTLDALALGGQEPYSYTIDFGDGSSAAYAGDQSFAHSYAAAGVYTATVTGRDQAGCTGRDEMVITVLAAGDNLLANRAAASYVTAAGAAYSVEAGAGIRIVPDLAIAKLAAPEPAVAGAAITYTLLVTNSGALAHGVVVTDTLPGEVSFGAATPLCSAADSIVTCALGDLARGETRTITITAAVDPAFSGVMTNTAEVAGTDPDPATGNNRAAAAATVVRVADLAIDKSSSPNPHVPGQPITYMVVVTNAGPSSVDAITVTEEMPAEVVDLVYAASRGVYTATTGAWTGVELAAGKRITLTLAGTVLVTQSGNLTNTASVTTSQASEPDGSNNWTQHVSLQAGLVLAKSGVLNSAAITPAHITNVGDTITYTLVATNTGTAQLDEVQIADPMLGTLECAQPASLAPGAALACTGVYTLTVGDVVSLQVANEATAYSRQYVPITAASVMTLSPQPALRLTKASNVQELGIGGTILYTLTVQNAGNLPFTDTVVSDPLLDLTAAVGYLGIDESRVITGSYGPVSEADLPGPIVNTASVTGTVLAASSIALEAPVTATNAVTLAISPALVLTTTSSPELVTIGDVVEYTITVQNTGDVTLADVTVTDPKLSLSESMGTLAVGEVATVTASYGPVTEADLPGPLENTASVTGVTPVSTTVGPVTGTHGVPVAILPGLALVKMGDSGPVTMGDWIQYTITVQNTGNVTLTDVMVDDPKLGLTWNLSGLVVGEVQTATASYGPVSEVDLPGPIANTASATGITPLGTVLQPVTATHSVPLEIFPGLAITKTGDRGPVTMGDMVQYTITVQNTGNVTLTAVTVEDAKLGLNQNLGTLAAGAVQTVTASYGPVTEGDLPGPIINAASVTAITPLGAVLEPVTATHSVPLTILPGLALATASSSNPAAIGDTVQYTITVQNTGNVTLTAVTLNDEKLGVDREVGTLPAGAAATVLASYGPVTEDDLPGPILNTASVTAVTPLGMVLEPVTATYSVPLEIFPGLMVTKTGSTGPVTMGDMVAYTITVQNTGDVTLADVTVEDAKLGLSQNLGMLAAGAMQTLTASYGPVSEYDLPGPIANTASVTGLTPINTQVGPVVGSYAVAVTTAPSLTLARTAAVDRYSAAGDVIEYAYVITNTGDVSLAGPVTVVDDKIADVICPEVGVAGMPNGRLLRGQSLTCTGSYTATQADVNEGSVTNVAFASADGITSPAASMTVAAVQQPALALEKSVAPASYNAAGQVLTYQYLVTNAGNVSLPAPVNVLDDKIAAVECPDASTIGNGDDMIDPQEVLTCMGSYVVTQEDVEAGSVTNTAVAKAGSVLSEPATATALAGLVAINDAAGVTQESAVEIRVLANDWDPTRGGLTVISVTQPISGAVVIAADGQSVTYTSGPGFWGMASFVYRAADANGQVDDAVVAVIVTAAVEGQAPPQVALADPQVGANATFSTPAASLSVQLPPGFITQTLGPKDIFYLSFTPVITPTANTSSPPANLRFGNLEFDLLANVNTQSLIGLNFAVPVTITIDYDPAMLGGLLPETLELRYWNGSEWANDGILFINHDVANYRYTLAITHLSRFALFAAAAPTDLNPGEEPAVTLRYYLPMISR